MGLDRWLDGWCVSYDTMTRLMGCCRRLWLRTYGSNGRRFASLVTASILLEVYNSMRRRLGRIALCPHTTSSAAASKGQAPSIDPIVLRLRSRRSRAVEISNRRRRHKTDAPPLAAFQPLPAHNPIDLITTPPPPSTTPHHRTATGAAAGTRLALSISALKTTTDVEPRSRAVRLRSTPTVPRDAPAGLRPRLRPTRRPHRHAPRRAPGCLVTAGHGRAGLLPSFIRRRRSRSRRYDACMDTYVCVCRYVGYGSIAPRQAYTSINSPPPTQSTHPTPPPVTQQTQPQPPTTSSASTTAPSGPSPPSSPQTRCWCSTNPASSPRGSS